MDKEGLKKGSYKGQIRVKLEKSPMQLVVIFLKMHKKTKKIARFLAYVIKKL